ncbi:MAG: HAMP domain-containing histidine kinase [Cyclobacteriaceae bacterium]|nr:HAMP domain-containing histidine kinase [Cyclobacteriaceae bacterium]
MLTPLCFLFVSLVIIVLLVFAFQHHKTKSRLANALKRIETMKLAVSDRDKLFSIIAHDLRSPMQNLSKFLELLVQNVLTEDESEKILKELSLTTRNNYHMMENLLIWSRNQMEGNNQNPVIFNIGEAARASERFLALQINEKEINIENSIPEELKAYADQSMVEVVIRNLLSNAIKFTPVKGRVWINAVEEENFVSVTVGDSGVGISAEEIDKIYALNYTTRGVKNEKGTGIGLHLCKEFVNKSGGNIFVKSQPGEGSEFTFTLPKNTK